MHRIEKTPLFEQVPKNFWPLLMAMVKERGAKSLMLRIDEYPGDSPILLDFGLKSAFYWSDTRQGHDFWNRMNDNTIGKMLDDA